MKYEIKNKMFKVAEIVALVMFSIMAIYIYAGTIFGNFYVQTDFDSVSEFVEMILEWFWLIGGGLSIVTLAKKAADYCRYKKALKKEYEFWYGDLKEN